MLIENVTDSHVSAGVVSNERGVVLIQPGVQLTVSVLNRLKRAKVSSLIISDEDAEGIDTREALDPRTYAQLKHLMRQVVATLEREQTIEKADWDAIRESARVIVEELESDLSSYLLYTAVQDDPVDRFIHHAINVALLGANVMLRLGARDHAERVAWAALLQDLGIWLMDRPARAQFIAGYRDDPKILRRHVLLARQFIRDRPEDLSPYVRTVVLQHHEHMDGSGQPEGRKGDHIHPLARIMAVVDTYVTLISRQHSPLLPHDAIEALMAGVSREFDQTALKAFQNAVHPYPIGTEVKMNTGEEGIVSGINIHLPQRPTVRIVRDARGVRVPPFEIDLNRETTRLISQVLN